ncbi:MAG: alpha-2-macroglobulin [Spirochaetales bacterium]|nr:alpha-2-macroglobulin [Spirochaetales bacterium]
MKQKLKNLLSKIRKLLFFLFGSIRYTPPGFLLRFFHNWKSMDKGARRTKVKKLFFKLLKIFLIIIFVLVLLAGILIGISYLNYRKPHKVVVDSSITVPALPRPGEEYNTPLSLTFTGSAAPKESLDEVVSEGVSIKPLVEGTWVWESDNRLVFTPSQTWQIGTAYQITLAKELFPSHIVVKELKKEFSTPAFTAQLSSPEFYIDPVDPSIKRVLANLSFNFPVDPDSMEGKIRIYPDIKKDSHEMVNRDYDFELNYNEEMTRAYLVSEPIGTPLKDVNFIVWVDEGIESEEDGGAYEKEQKRQVTIPGIADYVKIRSFSFNLIKNEKQVYDQVLILETKGEAKMEDLLENIEVWQLPDDRPAEPGLKKIENYRWGDTEFVTQDVLALSRKVELEPLPNEREYSSANSFLISADPNKYLYLKVKEGAPFYGGYYLAEEFERIVSVRDYPRELEILSDGNVLSLSGENKLSLYSRGVSNVGFKIKRILPDDINHLVSQSNGNITDFSFTGCRFDFDNISKSYEDDLSLNLSDRRELKYFSLDMSQYLETIPAEDLRYGLFMLEVGEKSRYGLDVMDKRLLMISDLGMLVKTNRDNSKDVFVQSIATGLPVANADVQVLGKNGIPLVSKRTDGEGHVSFSSLRFSKEENTPCAFIVVKGNDLSFLPYEAPGRSLDYSSFNVGGIVGAGDPGTLTTQIFSDRGLYRPGDSINGAFIVKAGDWSRALGGTPLLLTVTDPKGQTVHSESLILSAQGFNDFNFKTEAYSPTGSYQINLYLRKEKGYTEYLGGTTIEVEEFQPDRLKVSTLFNKSSAGWVSPEDLTARVSVRNLYGSPASGNRVTAQYSLTPAFLSFPQYRGYSFLQPRQDSIRASEELNPVFTDEEGKAEFILPLKKYEAGTYRLQFSVEAYEKSGGRGVAADGSILVSHLDHLVGYKADGDLNYIHKNSRRQIEFIAINSKGEKIDLPHMSLCLNRVDYVSSLVKQPNGVYKYQSIEQTTALSNTDLSFSAEGTTLSLDTEEPGKYEAEICDEEGNVLSRFRYTVVGESNLSRSLNRSAELEITLDKSDYKPGEYVELSISAPYKGAGLITIEKDKVYAWKWFTSDSTSSVQRIPIPADGLEGNGYITVSFIRSPDSREIFMSPLSYGSVPFSLDKESRTQKIELDYPSLVKPGEELPITYSTNRPGKIVIYGVDEGILQVAHYKLPDPISYFFRKQALEVKTSQILDLILPEYSVVRSFAAMGGGGDEDMLAANLNPFSRKSLDPVVYWSGILDSGPEERTVTYKVPDYFNGSLKLMAVAVSEEAVGSTEENALVRDTFIIQPSAPFAAIPGDKFDFKATVANNLSGSGENCQITLTLKGDEGLSPDVTEKTVIIPEGSDMSVSFPVTVNEVFGSASLVLTAQAQGESSRMSHSLSVRPAVPFRTEIVTGVCEKGKEDHSLERDMYPEFRTLEVSASNLPLGLAGGLNFYLSQYPYTCTEQLLSMSFPLLYGDLAANLDLSPEDVEESYKNALRILQYRQKSNGGFGLWTVKSESNPLVDLYALHYLLTAREKGLFIPTDLLDGALRRAGSLSRELGSSSYNMMLRSYAIFLLTKSGELTTASLEDLRKDLSESDYDWESGATGLYMAGSYSMLLMLNESRALLRKVKRHWDEDLYEDVYSDKLSYLSLYLTMISRYEPSRLKDVSSDLLDELAEELKGMRFTSYSASMALVALQSYVDVMEEKTGQVVSINQILPEEVSEALVMDGDLLKTGVFSPDAESIEIYNDQTPPLYYQIIQGGFDTAPPLEEQNHGLEVIREFLDLRGNVVDSMVLGEEYRVRLRIRSLDEETIPQVALVDLLPACLEPQSATIREEGNLSDRNPFQASYLDIREDRLVLYGNAQSRLLEYVYPVKATSTGSFTVPPLFAEAMYDQSTWALQAAGTLEVREE